MKYSLAVYGASGTSQSSQTALDFARAVLSADHTLSTVFFYKDGVHNASSLVSPPQDEQNLSKEWRSFIAEHNLDAVVCIAAALRRGVVNESESERYELGGCNLHEDYQLSGLGQLLDATIESDRLITFGE